MKQILLIMLGLSLAVQADFTKNGSIVTDNTTGLQWQDDAAASAPMAWLPAITYCENLTLGGHNDWRLPNIKTLMTLVDDSKTDPAIDDSTGAFQYTMSSNYWSSTTYAGNASSAWGVGFYRGYQYYDTKSNSLFVRCVRAGQ